MSGQLVGEVLDNAPADLRATDRLLLVALAEAAHADDRVTRCSSSVSELARRTGLSAGSCRNGLGRLTRRGLVVPLKRRAYVGIAQTYRIPKLGSATRTAIFDPPDM